MAKSNAVIAQAMNEQTGISPRTAPSQEVTQQGRRYADYDKMLRKYAPEISAAIPQDKGDLTVDRIIAIAANIMMRDPKFGYCEPKSIIGAVMQAAILGLNPTPQLAECYFIPYKRSFRKEDGSWGSVLEAQFQLGYRGLVKLYYDHELIKEIYPYCVYEHDIFRVDLGVNRLLVHTPLEFRTDISPEEIERYQKIRKEKGKILTHTYAVVHFRTGGNNFVYLDRDRIEELRTSAPGAKTDYLTGAWEKNYPAMAMGKALKQLRPYVPPGSGRAALALEADETVISLDNFKTGELNVSELPRLADEEAKAETEGLDVKIERLKKLELETSNVGA